MPEAYHQLLTYWPVTGSDGYGGNTYSSPLKIQGRWEEREEQFYLPSHEIALSKAVIYLPARRGVTYEVGSYIVRGVFQITDPTLIEGATVIRQVLVIPDLRAVRNEIRFML